MDLEEQFEKETGLSSTIPNDIHSDGYYSQEYVEWLEKKLTFQCELLITLKECREWMVNKGVNVDSDFFKRIDKAINCE